MSEFSKFEKGTIVRCIGLGTTLLEVSEVYPEKENTQQLYDIKRGGELYKCIPHSHLVQINLMDKLRADTVGNFFDTLPLHKKDLFLTILEEENAK